jgi:hypothetical protein
LRPVSPHGDGGDVFKYALQTQEGDDLGTFESMRSDWKAGDELVGCGNTRWRVVAVIPHERIAKFVADPEYGVVAVEPA